MRLSATSEVARLLKVSRITVQRWLKAGRLPAVRVGPKAVRIQRGALASMMQPPAAAPTAEPQTPRYAVIHTDLSTIPPLTEEEKRRGLEALEASRQLGERILARRGGQPLDESWPMIREAREERSRQLL